MIFRLAENALNYLDVSNFKCVLHWAVGSQKLSRKTELNYLKHLNLNVKNVIRDRVKHLNRYNGVCHFYYLYT